MAYEMSPREELFLKYVAAVNKEGKPLDVVGKGPFTVDPVYDYAFSHLMDLYDLVFYFKMNLFRDGGLSLVEKLVLAKSLLACESVDELKGVFGDGAFQDIEEAMKSL